ncbi:peptide chain release factor N(5)-glutamine methyltransferase [Paracoccus jiaweipingae]|uniref:peptide chain release factor N(5)-glutamine methyltransferase n=1 Tax=unclassified Paracoccus (in: a-proteobacteria) TaxID=2688777 RepID=UPI0037A14DE5
MTRTIRQALRDAVAALDGAGLADPARDARRLLAAALGVETGRLVLMADDALSDADAAVFDAWLRQRQQRRPVAQITGWRDFWGHRFAVTRDTLDPRPDTETLVAHALDLPWRSVLDLGTGTGAILISLLAERKAARGLGVDLSPAALAVARDNARRIGVAADFAESDWFSAVTGRFDLIVSNPPYIALDEMPALDPDVREWEPHLALTDGGDGLGAYRVIAARAGAFLNRPGRLAVEIGPAQGAAVSALLRDAGFEQVTVIADLNGRDRVVTGLWPENAPKSAV